MPFPDTLHGRTALVTGASRGIGRGVAAALADAGSAVTAAQIALEYGFTDVDGKQPRPLTLAEV